MATITPDSKPVPVEASEEISTKIQDVSNLGAVMDSRAEQSLVWKFDLRILPVLAIMYLFNSLDKSNLGNAKTAGLEGGYFLFPLAKRPGLWWDVDWWYRDAQPQRRPV